MEMSLCGAPYLPGLGPSRYPICLLMPHICWSPHLMFSPYNSHSAQNSFALNFPTFCSVFLKEARAERDHQGQASITGSPSPPSGTTYKQDEMPSRAGSCSKPKEKGSQKQKIVGCSVSFQLLLFCFISFHQFYFVSRFVFFLENCECYFRRLFVPWFLTLLIFFFLDSVSFVLYEC